MNEQGSLERKLAGYQGDLVSPFSILSVLLEAVWELKDLPPMERYARTIAMIEHLRTIDEETMNTAMLFMAEFGRLCDVILNYPEGSKIIPAGSILGQEIGHFASTS